MSQNDCDNLVSNAMKTVVILQNFAYRKTQKYYTEEHMLHGSNADDFEQTMYIQDAEILTNMKNNFMLGDMWVEKNLVCTNSHYTIQCNSFKQICQVVYNVTVPISLQA